MLSLPPSVRVYAALGATDMRKSFDGLSALTRSVIGLDPMTGHLFVFCNRSRNRVKVLLWDGSGFCIYHKRLARGSFAFPISEQSSRELRPAELSALLAGISFDHAPRRRWLYRVAASS